MTPAPDTGQTAEEMQAAPPAIPVRARYYLTKCPGCGWVGSSEQCGVDHGCDDSDVYCPVCGEAGCEDDPREADARAHGEAVMQRIIAAEAEAAQLRSRLLEAEKGAEAMRGDPGRAAYEARFAHARPRDVEPWDSLTPEVKAIWARVEAAVKQKRRGGGNG